MGVNPPPPHPLANEFLSRPFPCYARPACPMPALPLLPPIPVQASSPPSSLCLPAPSLCTPCLTTLACPSPHLFLCPPPPACPTCPCLPPQSMPLHYACPLRPCLPLSPPLNACPPTPSQRSMPRPTRWSVCSWTAAIRNWGCRSARRAKHYRSGCSRTPWPRSPRLSKTAASRTGHRMGRRPTVQRNPSCHPRSRAWASGVFSVAHSIATPKFPSDR